MKNVMKVSNALAAAALALVLTGQLASGQSAYAPAKVLAARWWQWAEEAPASQSPLTDQTGQFGTVNQPQGPVWFLAGNTGGTTVRTLTVPSGKALFFPIANVFDVEDGTAVGGGGKVFSVQNPLQTAQSLVADIIGTASGMSCSVDGVPVAITSDKFEQSTPFALQLGADNLFGLPAGVYYPVVDAGYYVLLTPLARGQHTIHFASTIGYFSTSLDVTYILTVQ